MRRAPGGALLRDRQRDPGTSRALDRPPQGRAFRGAPAARCAGGGPGRPGDLRELPHDRVPADAAPTSSASTSISRHRTADAYLARLQNLSDDRPLLMTELGLDSRAQGWSARPRCSTGRSRTARRQRVRGRVRVLVDGRMARLLPVRDGESNDSVELLDWDFGLTDRDRRPKPALAAVRDACARRSVLGRVDWPPVSVAVCTLQRRPHPGALPHRGRAAGLSGVRGDRRGRRLHRRDGDDRRAPSAAG